MKYSKETTHLWPHLNSGTKEFVSKLETDSAIIKAFSDLFPTHMWDISPIRGMNEIYVTAFGVKNEMNSDSVFYTSHTDGPFWSCHPTSVYRVLVGVTPNTLVRTRFNLHHETQDVVLDKYEVSFFSVKSFQVLKLTNAR